MFCLTSGGGSSKSGRRQRSIDLIEACGAKVGDHFAEFSDAEIYEAMLARDSTPFQSWATKILDHLLSSEGDIDLRGDMLEGYSPTHDMCRHVIDCIAEIANVVPKHNHSLALENSHPAAPIPGFKVSHYHKLNEDVVQRKLNAARNYNELQGEVRERLQSILPAKLSREYFYLTSELPYVYLQSGCQPFYEKYGNRRATEGKFDQVITFLDHIEPLASKLREAMSLQRRPIPVCALK